MSDFTVNPSIIGKEVADFKSAYNCLKNESSKIESVKNGLSLSGDSGAKVKQVLGQVVEQLEEYMTSTKTIYTSLEQIAKNYETAEKNIKNSTIKTEVLGPTADAGVTTSDGTWTASAEASAGSASVSNGDGLSASASGPNASAEASASATGVSAEASASVGSAEAAAEGKWAGISAEADALTVGAEATIGWTGAEASAAAAVLSGSVDGRLGLEGANVHAGAEGSVLGAGAEAAVGIVNDDGEVSVGAKAEAEAYIAKGEVSGGITIFGIDINVGVEGMVGVQASAGAELTTSSAGAELGFGPLELDIEIDWEDFDLIFWD